MTSDNSKSQIDFLDLKVMKIKIQALLLLRFNLRFEFRDLRLYYLTVQLIYCLFQLCAKVVSGQHHFQSDSSTTVAVAPARFKICLRTVESLGMFLGKVKLERPLTI